jgi:hypothetical protein
MNPKPAPSRDLTRILKRLKLSGIAATLPARAAYALEHKLHPLAFLELCLSDEVERRDAKNIALRIDRANLEEITTLERFDWNAPITTLEHASPTSSTSVSCTATRTSSFKVPPASARHSSLALSLMQPSAPGIACRASAATISSRPCTKPALITAPNESSAAS